MCLTAITSCLSIFIVFIVKYPPVFEFKRLCPTPCNYNTMDLVIRYFFVCILYLKTFSYPHTHNIHTNSLIQVKIVIHLPTLSLYIPHLPIMIINLCIHSSHMSHTFSITQIRINKHTYTSQKTTVYIKTILQLLNSHSCSYTRLSQIITSKHMNKLLQKIKPYRCLLTYFNLSRFCRVIYECLAVIIILLIINSNA